jgi:hypothetical protein
MPVKQPPKQTTVETASRMHSALCWVTQPNLERHTLKSHIRQNNMPLQVLKLADPHTSPPASQTFTHMHTRYTRWARPSETPDIPD